MAGVTETVDAGWVEAAERSIITAKVDYLVAANEDLAKLQQAYDAAVKEPAKRVEHVQAVYAQIQAIKGQGASFGYPLMTAVGNQLARFIEETGDNLSDSQLEVVKVTPKRYASFSSKRWKARAAPSVRNWWLASG